jgi:hypothetical protein
VTRLATSGAVRYSERMITTQKAKTTPVAAADVKVGDLLKFGSELRAVTHIEAKWGGLYATVDGGKPGAMSEFDLTQRKNRRAA